MVEGREELRYVKGKSTSSFVFGPTRAHDVGESYPSICGRFEFQAT